MRTLYELSSPHNHAYYAVAQKLTNLHLSHIHPGIRVHIIPGFVSTPSYYDKSYVVREM